MNNIIYKRGFCDGVFDGYHYGHVNALYQAKKKCEILVVATHSDEDIKNNKKTYPIFTFQERIKMLKYCKFIDILEDKIPTPYKTTLEILDNHKCDIFLHGDDQSENMDIILNDIKNANRLVLFKRTNGISTTDLKNNTKSYISFDDIKNIFETIYNDVNVDINIDVNDNIIYIDNNVNITIDKLLELKDIYKNYKLIIKNSSDTIDDYKSLIILISLNFIDKVIIKSARESSVSSNFECNILVTNSKNINHIIYNQIFQIKLN